MIPNEVQGPIDELRVNAIIQERDLQSMVPGSFTGVIVRQSTNDITVRKTTGEEYSVRLIDSALCADLQSHFVKCKENLNRFGSNLPGRKIEIMAALSTANGIALADRIKVTKDF